MLQLVVAMQYVLHDMIYAYTIVIHRGNAHINVSHPQRTTFDVMQGQSIYDSHLMDMCVFYTLIILTQSHQLLHRYQSVLQPQHHLQ